MIKHADAKQYRAEKWQREYTVLTKKAYELHVAAEAGKTSTLRRRAIRAALSVVDKLDSCDCETDGTGAMRVAVAVERHQWQRAAAAHSYENMQALSKRIDALRKQLVELCSLPGAWNGEEVHRCEGIAASVDAEAKFVDEEIAIFPAGFPLIDFGPAAAQAAALRTEADRIRAELAEGRRP